MKKLLSLLTITTLTTSVPAPLMAMKSSNDEWEIINKDDIPAPNRTKRNFSTLTSNSNNDVINDITNLPADISFVTKDNNNRIYFVNNENIYYSDDGNKAIKGKYIPVNGIKGLFFDKNNNIYIVSPLLGPRIWKNNKWDYLDNFRNYEKIKGTLIDDYLYFITESPVSVGGISFWKININTKQSTKLNSVNFMPNDIKNFNNIIYFLNKNKLYYSNDLGLTIKLLDINVPANSYTFDFDKLNNIYFGTDKGAFVLKQGEKTAKKIDGINDKVNSLYICNNYIYFNNKKYFDILSWTKQQSQFALIDSTKTQTWTRPDLLSVDGELNININNSNVTEVYWDGTKQNMLDHKVNINVKPETSEKEHNLQVIFILDGKQYTSEITVSMLGKIEPTPTPVQQNLSDLIKTTDLGNIIDNNDETIKVAITHKNARNIDFSQIKITDKTDTQATLSAIEGSKSYQGSVDVKYNFTPATTVDLKIDVTSTASGVQIDKDYLAQLDSSKMTNKVDTFYYANGKSTIKIKQPSIGNVITGVVYGCDDKWNKTSQSKSIDSTSGLEIDKGQYGSIDGRYLIELQHKHSPTHTKTIYLQVSEKQKVSHYWNTDNGKKFEMWAEDNGYKNIRGSSASHLNNLFELSATWKQSLKHLDLKLDNFVVDNIKNVTQDEINTYKIKMVASVKAQVEKYAPNVVENTDYKILVDNLVVGDWTTSKHIKAQAVDGSTKLLSFASKTIPVQQNQQPTPPKPTPDSKPDNNKKTGLGISTIFGIIVGSLVGLALLGWLFKRFVLDPFILKPIREKKQKAWRIREDKALAEIQAEEEAKKEKRDK